MHRIISVIIVNHMHININIITSIHINIIRCTSVVRIAIINNLLWIAGNKCILGPMVVHGGARPRDGGIVREPKRAPAPLVLMLIVLQYS